MNVRWRRRQRVLGFAEDGEAFLYPNRLWRVVQRAIRKMPRRARKIGVNVPTEDLPAYAENFFIALFADSVEHEVLHLVVDGEVTGPTNRKEERAHHELIYRLLGGREVTYFFLTGEKEPYDIGLTIK